MITTNSRYPCAKKIMAAISAIFPTILFYFQQFCMVFRRVTDDFRTSGHSIVTDYISASVFHIQVVFQPMNPICFSHKKSKNKIWSS